MHKRGRGIFFKFCAYVPLCLYCKVVRGPGPAHQNSFPYPPLDRMEGLTEAFHLPFRYEKIEGQKGLFLIRLKDMPETACGKYLAVVRRRLGITTGSLINLYIMGFPGGQKIMPFTGNKAIGRPLAVPLCRCNAR